MNDCDPGTLLRGRAVESCIGRALSLKTMQVSRALQWAAVRCYRPLRRAMTTTQADSAPPLPRPRNQVFLIFVVNWREKTSGANFVARLLCPSVPA